MKYLKNYWDKISEYAFLILLAMEIILSLLRRTRILWPDFIDNLMASVHYFYIPLIVVGIYAII